MKTKKTLIVPDNLFEVLGFLLPTSEKKPEYVKGESITDFIGSQRIDTLKRESRYRTYYPKLKSINLLSLNYPSIPLELYRKVGYIKKIIRKNIIKTINSISPDRRINEECTKYINGVLSIYGKTLRLYRLQDVPDSSANIASCILQSREIFCITFQSKQGAVLYTDPFAKKRKYGYFYLKSIPEEIVHIIDLPDFLTDVLLIQTLHHIQTKIKLPAVQNIFETFIQIHSKPDQKLKNTWEVNEFISSLIFKTILPDGLLFHDYSSGESECFELGLSYDVSEKLIQVHFGGLGREARRAKHDKFFCASLPSTGGFILLGLDQQDKIFCNILDVYQDIHYENMHRNEMNRTIATAYMTKKNIPKKVLTVMENTSFKKYFKYVEFDEEVNLNSVKISKNDVIIQ